VSPLGKGAVALSAGSQEDAGAVVVDEYARDPATGRWGLRRVASCIADFLSAQGVSAALVPDARAAAAAGPAGGNAARAAAGGASPQSTNHVLMVAPTAFGFNEQAAQDNSFMHTGESAAEGGSALTRQVGNGGGGALDRPRRSPPCQAPLGPPRGLAISRPSPSTLALPTHPPPPHPPPQVLREFAALHRQLTDFAGVSVTLMQHAVTHGTPDACFPNNWISTHAPGEGGGAAAAGGGRTLVLYPMKCPNRAAERRPDVIAAVQAAHGPYDR
jgi:hypothetical protein